MLAEPLIPATVIGSWSFPGWYEKFVADVNAEPGRFGPADREEAVRDAVRLAVDDQLRAGLDRITDGEMQRVDFNLGFYEYLHGLEPLPPARRWGAPAHDQRDRYRCVSPLSAPAGLGTVAEYRRLREITAAPAKVPVPGPFTLAGCIDGGAVYDDRTAVTEALVPIVNAELQALVAAGVDFIQLDEPSFACHPGAAEAFLDVVGRTVEGVKAYISMHMCFGNYRARAVGRRSYRPLFPQIGRAPVNQLALEFASREMAEVELLAELPETMDVAVGLVDVKNTWIEPPELVAERLRTVLKYVAAERVSVTPDCGFSQTARHVATAKARAMVEGVKRVRGRAEAMIEPVRQGVELVEEIAGTVPAGPVRSVVWWLGQSGFLFKSPTGLLAVDLYLSEHLTQKYEATDRPHVRMTRAPIAGRRPARSRPRPGQPQAFRPPRPGDLARSAGGVARRGARAARGDRGTRSRAGLPRRPHAWASMRGGVVERAGFRVQAIPSAHEGLDTDAAGRHLYLGYVIEAEGCRLYHSGDSLAYDGLAERLGDDPVRCPVPADQRPGPGAGRAGQHVGGRGRRPGGPRSGRGSSCRIITTCSPSTRSPSRRSRPRPAGCPRGSSRGSSAAGSAGRSRRERHAGNRHRDLRDQDAGDRRAGDDPGLGVGRVSLRPSPARAGRSKTPSSGGSATVETVGQVLAAGKFRPEDVAGIGLSGQMHGSVFLDAAGEVIRPALLWNDQRTAAECREIERQGRRPRGPDPAGRQPGPDRVHRAQAPVGPQARAAELGAGPPGAPAQGLRPLPPDRHVCHRGERRLGHALARRRQPPLEPRAAGQAPDRPGALAAVLREPGGLRPGERAGVEGDRAAGRARRWSAAAATSRPGRWATGSSGRAWSRRRWGPRGSSSRMPTSWASTRSGGSSAAATPCRAPGTSWASCWRPAAASSGSATSWARPRSRWPSSRARTRTSSSPTRPRWPARGPRGCSSCPT